MPTPALALWTISREGGHANASRDGDVIAAPTPAAMWQAIAGRSGGCFIHVAEEEARPDRAALTRAARMMERDEVDALIGRIRYADGHTSARLKQIEMVRHLEVPQGALLATSEAMAGAANAGLRAGFDEFWAYDLANALALGGLTSASDEIFASVPAASPDRMPCLMPFKRASHLEMGDPDAPVILVYGRMEATVGLYFDALPADLRACIRFLRPGDMASDIGWLAMASLVIVVRDFDHMILNGTRDLLTEIGVPYFWFTDDDLVALGAETPAFRYYGEARVRSFTAAAAGIIATSPALAGHLARFNGNVFLWPCQYDAALAPGSPSPRRPALRVGAFGGAFRQRSFTDHLQPALRDVGRDSRLEVFANAELARGRSGVNRLAFEESFRNFVFRWQRLGLNALAHPYGDTANITSKSPASVLAAVYLGAVPIVGDEPAYEGFTEEVGILKAAPDSGAWRTAITRLTDPRETRLLYDRLDAWCREAFGPEKARETVDACLRFALSGGANQQALRWQHANRSRALRKALATAPARRPARFRLWRGLKRRWRRYLANR